MLKIELIQTDGTRRLHKSITVSRDFVTADNEEVWQAYLCDQIEALIQPEAMESEDYLNHLQAIEERKRLERHLEERRSRRSYLETLQRLPKLAYIPDGETVNYTEAYRPYVDALVQWTPRNREDYLYQLFSWERMVTKSFDKLTAIHRPDAAYALLTAICERLPLFVGRTDLSDYAIPLSRRIRKMVRLAYSHLMQSALLWNHESARQAANLLMEQQAESFRMIGLKETWIGKIQTFEPLQGEPIAIQRRMNREESGKADLLPNQEKREQRDNR